MKRLFILILSLSCMSIIHAGRSGSSSPSLKKNKPEEKKRVDELLSKFREKHPPAVKEKKQVLELQSKIIKYQELFIWVQKRLPEYEQAIKAEEDENKKNLQTIFELNKAVLQQERELNHTRTFSFWQNHHYTSSAILLASFIYSYIHFLHPILMKKKHSLKPSFKRKLMALCALDLREIWSCVKSKKKKKARA